MIQVVLKWQITVYRGSQEPLTFGYSDNHASNVLRAVAQMDFGADVKRIDVQLEQRQPATSGLTTFISAGFQEL